MPALPEPRPHERRDGRFGSCITSRTLDDFVVSTISFSATVALFALLGCAVTRMARARREALARRRWREFQLAGAFDFEDDDVGDDRGSRRTSRGFDRRV